MKERGNMSKMKWFISLLLSLGLLAGCEEAAVKPEKKVEPKQEEVAKQEEKKMKRNRKKNRRKTS